MKLTTGSNAEELFSSGQSAPRGTYLCLATGIVHRLSRPASLPEGGPFRQVAPTDTLGAGQPSVLAERRAPRTGAGRPPALAPAIADALQDAEQRASLPALRWPEEEPRPREQREAHGWANMLALYHLARNGRGW